MFFDFGPIFDQWEADFGRTFINSAATRASTPCAMTCPRLGQGA